MTKDIDDKKKTRRDTPPIKVYCTPDEKELIQENAKAAGKSVSSFLNKVGQGYKVSGVVDQYQVLELAKVNGDLGRLGGLMKLWLTNDERLAHFDVATINQLLVRIETLQDEMGKLMTKIVRPRVQD